MTYHYPVNQGLQHVFQTVDAHVLAVVPEEYKLLVGGLGVAGLGLGLAMARRGGGDSDQ